MKKLLAIILIIFCNLFTAAFADILPLSSKSIKHYGIGVINIPKTFKVYQYPYTDAKIIKEFNYDGLKRSAIVNTTDMRKVSYIAYVPSNNVALLTVEEKSENGWYCICIDQNTGETGWVQESDEDAFFTYKDLFYKYGKRYGVRMFSDLSKDEKVLYSKEDKSSQILERLSYPKSISFTVIRGNWMLASVYEMNRPEKIGWYNWRNDDGTLNMFPNFKD